jgi:glutamate mutase epsilon subunit
MDKIQVRTGIIAYLEGALNFAEEIKDSTTAYLFERALDEARSKAFSSVPPEHQLSFVREARREDAL